MKPDDQPATAVGTDADRLQAATGGLTTGQRGASLCRIAPQVSTLSAAVAYREHELSVIPIMTDGSKRPALRTWAPYQRSLADHDQIAGWFEHTDLGIAIVCGAVSGELEVLDFDEPGLFQRFEKVCHDTGAGAALKRCPTVATPSGGRHVYYKVRGQVEPGTALAHCVGADTPKKVLIETRGKGNYVIAPPSCGGVHPSGGAYTLVGTRDLNEIPTLTASDRKRFVAAARSLDRMPVADGAMKRSVGARAGDRYNEDGDYEGLMARHGWTRVHAREDGVQWRRPGKTGSGISATTGRNGMRGLFVFSTSAAPFEAGRGYTPFAVYTMLEHDGDYKAAARALGGVEIGMATGIHLGVPFTVEPGLADFRDAQLRAGRLRPIDWVVYESMWLYVDSQQITFVSQETIARRLGYSERHVARSVSSLKSVGLIRAETQGGCPPVVQYRMTAAYLGGVQSPDEA